MSSAFASSSSSSSGESPEEDFVASVYGLNLQEGFSEMDVAKLLNEVEEATQARIRARGAGWRCRAAAARRTGVDIRG